MRLRRALTRVVALLALVGQGAGAAPRSRPREERRPVDRTAIREALTAAAGDEGFSSPASYAHFLQARLLHLAGDHRGAVDELRLALVSDDGNPHLLTRLGEAYARLGDSRRAERELRRAVERHPSYPPARLMLGRVLMEAGRYARARLHLRRAIQLQPREPEAYLVLAQLHLEQRQPEQAVKVVEELAAALPGEASGYRRLGLALAERGEDVRAERMLARALERAPDDVEARLSLARLHEKAGRLADAEEALAQALEREPDNQEVLLGAGRLALRLGSSVRARAYFDRLLSLSEEPELSVRVAFAFLSARDTDSAAQVLEGSRQRRQTSPRISFYTGLVYERQRRFLEAATAYAEVPVSSELFPDARTRRALCLSQAGEHASALQLLRQGLAERPDDAELHVQLARTLERGGSPAQAVASLEEVLARQPSPALYEALASTLQRQGHRKEAVRLLRDAVERMPREPALRYALGGLLQAQGDDAGAIFWLRSVLKLEPDHAAALNFIGYLLAQRGGDMGEAERLVRRALALRPDTGAFLDSLGWISYQRGDYPRALEWLEQAARLEPEEPVILEHLGDTWLRLSRPQQAAEAWRRALEALRLHPESADPPDQRTVLERKLKFLPSGAAGH